MFYTISPCRIICRSFQCLKYYCVSYNQRNYTLLYYISLCYAMQAMLFYAINPYSLGDVVMPCLFCLFYIYLSLNYYVSIFAVYKLYHSYAFLYYVRLYCIKLYYIVYPYRLAMSSSRSHVILYSILPFFLGYYDIQPNIIFYSYNDTFL